MHHSFHPPRHIVFHEVGHAMMCFATRVGIEEVSVETFFHAGRVDIEGQSAAETHHLISIAGPVAQQMFAPDSVKDNRLRGLLFNVNLAHDYKHWKNMEVAVSPGSNCWHDDLWDFYRTICTPLATCAERVPPFARAEEKTRSFLAAQKVTEAAHVLADELISKNRVSGADAEAIISQFFAADMFSTL